MVTTNDSSGVNFFQPETILDCMLASHDSTRSFSYLLPRRALPYVSRVP